MPDPDLLSLVDVFGWRSETWLYRQIADLKRHSVHVFAHRYVNSVEHPHPHVTVSSGPVTQAWRKSTRRLGFGRLATVPTARKLRSLLRKKHFRVLQAHFGYIAAEYHDMLEADARPVVVWLYGSDVFRSGTCRDEYLPRLFASRAHLCCISRALRNECIALGCVAKKIAVIYPGIDITDIPPRHAHDGPLRIVSVGRLVDVKDPIGLVRVARMVADSRIDFTWTHLGEGPMRADVERAIVSARLAGRFRLRGEVANAEVLHEFDHADLMVHLATVAPDGGRESFGVVLVEAASRGLPVVANAVGGIPEIVVDGVTGFLLSPGDSSGMVDRVIELADSRQLRAQMSEAATERARECFRRETQVDRLDEFYDELIGSAV